MEGHASHGTPPPPTAALVTSAPRIHFPFFGVPFFVKKVKELLRKTEITEEFLLSSQEFLAQGKEPYLGQESNVKRKRKESEVK